MANQFIYLFIHIINPFSASVFWNSSLILGQAYHSPTLSSTEAARAAEKIGGTRMHNSQHLKRSANPTVTAQHSSQVLS